VAPRGPTSHIGEALPRGSKGRTGRT
jgi:hypothetical protein